MLVNFPHPAELLAALLIEGDNRIGWGWLEDRG